MNDTAPLTLVCPFIVTRGHKGKKKLQPEGGQEARPTPGGSTPNITRVLALAIKLDAEVRTGKLRNFAEVAGVGKISPSRVTQIMNLLHLAPDIQEEILFFPPCPIGEDPIIEDDVRQVAAQREWDAQRTLWAEIAPRKAG